MPTLRMLERAAFQASLGLLIKTESRGGLHSWLSAREISESAARVLHSVVH